MQMVRNTLGQVQASPPQPCRGCGDLMVGQYAYRGLSADERRKYRRHQGHDLCDRCYRIERGDRTGHEGRWLRADLIYEWEFLASQGYSRRAAARRLHVSYQALCKAIERSRNTTTQETAA